MAGAAGEIETETATGPTTDTVDRAEMDGFAWEVAMT
jgi:hypothetical protein